MEERRTVIVVDDSDEIRDVITLLLEQEGYKVLPVEDGETALMMSKRLLPALITLDLGLPGQNGQEILRRLKSDPETSVIPVLVVSGQADVQHLLGDCGADAILGKPFDIDEMQRIVSSLIQNVA